MKRVIKLKVDYLEGLIRTLRNLNSWTDDQVMEFCDRSKEEAMENVIRGLVSTVNQVKEVQERKDQWAIAKLDAAQARCKSTLSAFQKETER